MVEAKKAKAIKKKTVAKKAAASKKNVGTTPKTAMHLKATKASAKTPEEASPHIGVTEQLVAFGPFRASAPQRL